MHTSHIADIIMSLLSIYEHNLGKAIIFYDILKFRLNAMTNKMQSKCKNAM